MQCGRSSRGVDVINSDDHRTDHPTTITATSAHVLTPRTLYQPRHDILALPLHRATDRVVILPLGTLLQVAQVAAAFGASAEKVLSQRVENVDAVDAVAVTDGDVEQHEAIMIRQRYTQRLLQAVDELAESRQRDVLRRFLVEQLPDLVVHIEVVLRQSLLDVLGRLAEVFEDDGDVHVNDDEEADDQVGDDVDDALAAVAAIAVRSELARSLVALILVHQSSQDPVPAGRRRDLE